MVTPRRAPRYRAMTCAPPLATFSGMPLPHLADVRALTFDLFGTVLDLGGSLTPPIAEFLRRRKSGVDPGEVWRRLRHRQRIEQYQDNIVAMGHSGYLPVARRATIYVLGELHVD